MKKFEGKTALVTGASRGIGKGICEALAAEGAGLIMVARGREALQRVAADLQAQGAHALAVVADVTVESQVRAAFAEAMERFGRLDLLVNNAGVSDGGALEEITVETWDKVMAANLRGPFLCTREAFRIMKPAGGGRIINLGSLAARRVRPLSAAYSTSKHGIWGLTQVSALEGREFGIACGCIFPGNVLTEKNRSRPEPMMTVEELVQAVVAMASLPAHVNMLEAVVLPVGQPYVGRG
jgi:NAD(P)-dependent dehydrogenase (short-subunit alcohol dehydrogenase family)